MHSDGFAPTFEGRLTDGRTAATRPVDVRLGRGGIEILARDGQASSGASIGPLVWPYGAISTSEPLGVHAVDALVTYAYQPGATLFVASGHFARALAEAAPHLTARAVRWRNARPWLFAVAALAALAGLAVLAELSPARTLAAMIPERARVALGERTVAAMTSKRPLCEAAAGRAALDTLTERLSRAAGGDRRFKVVVADWGLVNAFAAPAERIVLTRGLIEKADSADEVAGVLAHEMGHGLELHPETSLVRAVGLSAATELILGGSGGTIANIGLLMVQIGYTRGAEEEADTQALRILREAAISPRGLGVFFRRVLRMEQPTDQARNLSIPDVLRTHPPSEERARRVERIAPYPATPALTASEWAALRAICAEGGSGGE